MGAVSGPPRCLLGPLGAVAFLTTLPLPSRLAPGWDSFGRSLGWFPGVGLLLGAVLAAIDLGLSQLFSPPVAGALLAVALLALSGGLHADGLVDTCDAVFAPVTVERRLEIMRDPRAGAFGVMGLVSVVVLKVVAIAALPPGLRLGALALGPVLGRWAIVVAVSCFSYGRSHGAGAPLKQAVRPATVLAATILPLALAAFLGPWALILVALALLLVGGLGWWLQRRLGGLTGDCYGAICEVVEAAVWLGAPLAYTGLRGPLLA